MRNWSLAECQQGGAAAPEGDDPQQAPAPNPVEPPQSARAEAAGFALVVVIVGLAVVLGAAAANAIMASAF